MSCLLLQSTWSTWKNFRFMKQTTKWYLYWLSETFPLSNINLISVKNIWYSRNLLYTSKLNVIIFSFSGKWQLVACQHDSAFPKALICFHFWKKRRNRERNLVINHPVQDGKILFSISADVDVVSAQFR